MIWGAMGRWVRWPEASPFGSSNLLYLFGFLRFFGLLSGFRFLAFVGFRRLVGFNDFLNPALHVEVVLTDLIVLAFEDFLEAAHGVGHRHLLSLAAGEDFSD